MSTRADIQTRLVTLLPADKYEFVDNLGELGEPNPGHPNRLQLIRTALEPTDMQGSYWQEFELWAVVPDSDPEDVETAVDDVLSDVLPILDLTDWMLWTRAERAVHPNGFHGYRITFKALSTSTQ